MTQKLTVTYYITDDGWVYTDSFGLAQLEGRVGNDVGVELIDGVRTLVIPEQVDGMDVYILAFRSFMQGFEALYVPDGVGIILPYAFAGCAQLQSVRVPEDMYDIDETAFLGTGLSEARQKELHAMGRMRQEQEEERCRQRQREAAAQTTDGEEPEEPGSDIPF